VVEEAFPSWVAVEGVEVASGEEVDHQVDMIIAVGGHKIRSKLNE
jgi:hypothetical protein